MPHEEIDAASQPLGEFLREHRMQQGISLEDVSEATKISLPILQAIEEDAYERMPAEAFCRGFYTLYANFLDLAPKTVLDKFQCQQGIQKKSKPSSPPMKKCRNSANYAEPSSISPGTSMTFLLLTALLIFAGVCWYLKWNPVDYLSTKFMPPAPTLEQEQPESVQQLTTPYQQLEEPAVPETKDAKTSSSLPDSHENISASEIIPPPPASQNKDLAPIAAAPYIIDFTFTTSSTLKVTLDDGFVLEKHFNAGDTQRWEAENTLVLDMPETSHGRLRLNGIEIPLPEALDGRRVLSLPEDFLNIN